MKSVFQCKRQLYEEGGGVEVYTVDVTYVGEDAKDDILTNLFNRYFRGPDSCTEHMLQYCSSRLYPTVDIKEIFLSFFGRGHFLEI